MGVGANPTVLFVAGLAILVLTHFWFLTRKEMPMKNNKRSRKANLKTKSTVSRFLGSLFITTRELAANTAGWIVCGPCSIHQKGAHLRG